MSGKSEGTGQVNDEGKVVKEIKANLVDLDPKITKLVSDNFHELLYQNDGMGAPTEEIDHTLPPPGGLYWLRKFEWKK